MAKNISLGSAVSLNALLVLTSSTESKQTEQTVFVIRTIRNIVGNSGRHQHKLNLKKMLFFFQFFFCY